VDRAEQLASDLLGVKIKVAQVKAPAAAKAPKAARGAKADGKAKAAPKKAAKSEAKAADHTSNGASHKKLRSTSLRA